MDPEDYYRMKEELEGKTKKKRVRVKKDKQTDEEQVEGKQGLEDLDKQIHEEEKKQAAPNKKQGANGKNAKKDGKSSQGESDEKLNESQKKIRNAKKKLRQIELLEDKQRAGTELSEEEIAKIKSKKETLTLIKDLSIK